MKQPVVDSWPWHAPRDLFEALFLGEPGAFWLDSALHHEEWGRFAIMGGRPISTVCTRGEDAFAALRAALPQRKAEPVPGLPFTGGLVGYLAYEAGQYSEPVELSAARDPEAWDQVWLAIDTGLVCDRERGVVWAFSWGMERLEGSPDPERARARLDAMRARLGASTKPERTLSSWGSPPSRSSLSREAYLEGVETLLEAIRAGDVYQANLTYRLEIPKTGDPYDIFLALREESPTWFSAYLDLGDTQIASASPERFLHIRDGRIEVRPMKGTRPRGATEDEDQALYEALCQSEKDRAENLMIVDLMRNDLHQVCALDSVEVRELFTVEAYSTVFQMTSTVEGRLREDVSVVDAIRACFPPGSMTGAPKIAAMQLIDQLEPTARGIYSGALGYIGFDGQCDLSVTIRTLIVEGERAWWHVGGGIVADSDPEAEYQETLDKTAALKAALAY